MHNQCFPRNDRSRLSAQSAFLQAVRLLLLVLCWRLRIRIIKQLLLNWQQQLGFNMILSRPVLVRIAKRPKILTTVEAKSWYSSSRVHLTRQIRFGFQSSDLSSPDTDAILLER